MKTEKERRIYYQDIVYHVCNALDKIDGDRMAITCGTVETPTTQVQDRMDMLKNEYCALNTLNQKLRIELNVKHTQLRCILDAIEFAQDGNSL